MHFKTPEAQYLLQITMTFVHSLSFELFQKLESQLRKDRNQHGYWRAIFFYTKMKLINIDHRGKSGINKRYRSNKQRSKMYA